MTGTVGNDFADAADADEEYRFDAADEIDREDDGFAVDDVTKMKDKGDAGAAGGEAPAGGEA